MRCSCLVQRAARRRRWRRDLWLLRELMYAGRSVRWAPIPYGQGRTAPSGAAGWAHLWRERPSDAHDLLAFVRQLPVKEEEMDGGE
jgi:hypothetical protein